jgi:uncharacterized membrane protein YfcA
MSDDRHLSGVGMFEGIADVFTADLAFAAAVAIVSGIVHGYTGFGAALVMVPLLALLYGPVEAIAVTSIAGLIGSSPVYLGAARIAVWREVGPLMAAAIIATPLGVVVLFSVDPEWIRRAIGLFVLMAALLLMSGWVYRGRRGAVASAVTGTLCGAVSGVAGVGGPPVVVYFIAAPHEPAVQRANIVISVGVVIPLVLGSMAIGGAVDGATLVRGIVAAPFYMAGFHGGTRLFGMAPQSLFRKIALWLLIATGLTAVVF